MHFVFAGVMSILTNVLVLSYPLYMVNVYTRVIESRSIETLIALFVGFGIAVAFKVIFDWLKSELYRKAALRLQRRLNERVVTAVFYRRASGRPDSGAQALRDLDIYRNYVSQRGIPAMLELPWAGLFLGILLWFDWMIGATAICAMLALAAVECIKALSMRSREEASAGAIRSLAQLDLNLQGAEAVIGMGMLPGFLHRWHAGHSVAVAADHASKGNSTIVDALGGGVAMLFQGMMLGVAAYQVLQGSAPSGVMFACAILFGFAIRPVKAIIGAWADLGPVRLALARLDDVLVHSPKKQDKLTLPRPEGVLTIKGLTYVAPGGDRPILRGLNFGLEAGRSLGVIGLIGSGKTSLARVLVGCVKPSAGFVRLDGSDVWDIAHSNNYGHVGYLPQSIGILPASVADNIGHFGMFGTEEIIEAARLAGIHDMILRFPQGYDTAIGEGGFDTSGGQRQLIGLARAIVGRPSLVVLDEPNSNLDGPGEGHLMNVIAHLREQRITVVMISHRPQLMRQFDRLIVLREGIVVAFGESEEVWATLGRPTVVKRLKAAGE